MSKIPKTMLIGLTGFLAHAALIIGNPNSKFNLLWMYERAAENQPDIFMFLFALLTSILLAGIYFVIARSIKKYLIAEALWQAIALGAGSLMAFLSLWLLIFLAWRNF